MGTRGQSIQPQRQLVVGKVPLSESQIGHELTIGPGKCFDLLRVERTQSIAFAACQQAFELCPARLTARGKVTERWHPPSTASLHPSGSAFSMTLRASARAARRRWWIA